MIIYNYQDVDFLFDENAHTKWLSNVIVSEEKKEGEIEFIFCTDEYLLDLNQRFLNHDTYTDIITFDNSMGNILGADIFISIDRVKENASDFKVDFNDELLRVLVHGVLHLCGYKDKTEIEALTMRTKENEKIDMFHVEQ